MSQANVLEFNETQTMLQSTVREFAQKVLAPRALPMDEAGRFNMDNFRGLAELGLTGIPIPEEYGGAGADYTSYAIAVEEISRVCGSTALTLCAHTSLGTLPMVNWGSEELKRKYVPPNARGEKVGAYGLTEPGAGSDSGATSTKAVKVPGGWRITGTKMFVTNGSFADTYVVTAVTDPDKAKHERISAFVLERGFDGIVVAKREDKLGVRGSDTCIINFENVFVPDANLLGVRGDGFKYFMKTLDSGRIVIGAMALGLAQGAFDKAVAYSRDRKAFGGPISEQQAIQFLIADAATEIHAARLMIYHAAGLRDAGRPFSREAAMAKLFASEMAMRACRSAIQILGGYGFMTEYEVERHYRDAKLCEIGEGTSEIQRIVIARHILKALE